ncbi:UNVERIFIED_CONTAM: OmpW family outer membrane protein [Methylobacteriaceae bacterium AG10]|nr:OmpW family outer membrane protein [Methylobacteriaceae bacterium AG10]
MFDRPVPSPPRSGRAPRRRVAVAAALCLFAASTPCRASDTATGDALTGTATGAATGALTAGSLLVRGRVVGAIPVGQFSRVEPIGGRVVTPARPLPDLDVTYFLSDHVAVAGQVGVVSTRTSIRGSLIGDLPIGTTWSLAMTGAVQVHLFPRAAFNPYLGAGAGYTHPLAYEPAKPLVTAMKADPQLGPMLQAGFDYHLVGEWYANMEIKKIFLPPQVSRIGPGSATVRLDMLIIGAGIGYRF